MSEGMTSGYIPGSVVWVPWSVARPERRRTRRKRMSLLQRLFQRKQRPSLYQRCLAIHIMTSGETEEGASS